MSNKILFIAPSNSIHSIKWIENCIDKKVEVYWISFYRKNELLDSIKDSVNYFEITTFNPLSVYIHLRNILKKNNFSVVHLHYIGRMTYILLFFKIKNFIISPWGSDLKMVKKASIKGLIIKYLFEKANLITVDAAYMKKEVQKFTHKISRIEQINFGTDTNVFYNYNLNKNNVRIVSLRNLETLYDIGTLISASSILYKKYKMKNFTVDIFGQGSQQKNLSNQINKLGLNEIINLKGRYDYKNLPKLLNNYDIYVSTSTSDAGLAASTSEAMACELLIVTADNSENRFWMNDKCGFLFTTSNSNDLADKINEIVNIPVEEKNKFRVNARKKIIKLNSIESEMTKMKALYGIY